MSASDQRSETGDGNKISFGAEPGPAIALSGVYPYLVTPLEHGPDEILDRSLLATLTNNAIGAGVHGLTPLGSTGEFPFVPPEMRTEVIETVVEAADGRVPVVPGIGGFSVTEARRQAELAEESGADGVLCILQAFFSLRDQEMRYFFEAVADATRLPMVIYHNPATCHFRLTADVLSKLADVPNIVAVKDASGDLSNLAEWVRVFGERFRVFASTSMSPTEAIRAGAVGWMSGPACALPGPSVKIFELALRDEWDRSLAMEEAIAPVLELFRRLGPGRAMKAFLRAGGVDAGEPFLPLSRLEGSDLDLARVARTEVDERFSRVA